MSEPKKPGKGCAWFLVALIAVGVVWGVVSEVGGSAPPEPGQFHNADTTLYSDVTRYDGGLLPAVAPDAAEQLSQSLAELEKAYGICFGWSLEDGSTKKVQSGSSRGPGVAANTCPRWLETRVAVGYTSDSSESPDGVRVGVGGSSEFTKLPSEDDFARLGVTGPVLVEDPVGGTGHAALGLPLLMVESGALQAVATPPPADRPTPRPLGPAGSSDFPLSTTLTLSGLGVGIVLCVVLGFWMRARARKKEGAPSPGPSQPGQTQPGQAQPGQQSAGQQAPGYQQGQQPPGYQPGQQQPGTQPGQQAPGQQQPGYQPGQHSPGYQPEQQPGQQSPGQQVPGYQPEQQAPGQQSPGYQPEQQPGQQPGYQPGQQQPGQQQPGQQQPGQQQPGQQQPGQQQPGQQQPGYRPGQQPPGYQGWPGQQQPQQPHQPQQPQQPQQPHQRPPYPQQPGQWPPPGH